MESIMYLANRRPFGSDGAISLTIKFASLNSIEIREPRECSTKRASCPTPCISTPLSPDAVGGASASFFAAAAVEGVIMMTAKYVSFPSGRAFSHTINIEPDTILFKVFGSETGRVNSYHHQAVREPAEGFIISARSTDMIIEAMESQKHKFVLGVQFHPEMMWERHQEAADIFSAFVESCM